MALQGFGKEEKLKSKKEIENLMKKGLRIKGDTLSAIYLKRPPDDLHPVRVAFSVPKRKFKRAVERNLLKRRMREVYRKNKIPLIRWCETNNIGLDIMFVYYAPHVANYKEVEDNLVLHLKSLSGQHEKHS